MVSIIDSTAEAGVRANDAGLPAVGKGEIAEHWLGLPTTQSLDWAAVYQGPPGDPGRLEIAKS